MGRPKVAQNAFDDLLGGFSAAKRDDGPKTIKDMRKDQLAKDVDPDTLKVSPARQGRRPRHAQGQSSSPRTSIQRRERSMRFSFIKQIMNLS